MSVSLCALLLIPSAAHAKKPIRDEFFAIYPSAENTVLDNQVASSSKVDHCGVCHYDFGNGGNPWNPYGWSIKTNMDNGMSDHDAILAVAGFDQDGDGYSSQTEILDTASYVNTPTFPGLSAANVGQVMNVSDLGDIQPYLTPSVGGDTEPPEVALLYPNGGEVLTADLLTNIVWTAEDEDSGLASFDLYVSIDGGATFEVIALNQVPSGETNALAWFPANRPTSTALIRVVARDNDLNSTNVQSASFFTIVSPPGGIVPTTLRDFDMPGSQPHELVDSLAQPSSCISCHGGYDTNHEPQFNWQGSMMAHASIDPLFEANLTIANQDAPESGDICLRCHIYAGWVQGRSVPTSGKAMLPSDKFGVSCGLCHRLIDPIYEPGVSPPVDEDILTSMLFPGTEFGTGMAHLDPSASRRGPFSDATNAPHVFTISPFHREAALCGTCHDVSNPAFDRNPDGSYSPNALDAPATDFSASVLAPVERTYSEWLFSEFNSTDGVYLPRFAGNKTNGLVSTCQDCHMRDVLAYGADDNQFPLLPLRPDMPLHDLTGGSTWLPMVLADLYPDQVNSNAVAAGAQRATSLLQNAADMVVNDGAGSTLTNIVVTITNQCGHKLPTGYPEGRRIWINVQFYGAETNLLAESGAYNPGNGLLSHDAEAKIYEIHPGIDSNLVSILHSLGHTNFAEGPSFHFVLNNAVYEDNRIPPRGFTNALFDTFGGAPVGHAYADGQYWDDTPYRLPEDTKWAEVKLYYQSTSKEFVEFLRDENTTDDKGQEMHDIWSTNSMCPPTLMQAATWVNPFLLGGVEFTNNVFRLDFHCRTNSSYTIQYTDSLESPVVWSDFQSNGTQVPVGDTSFFEDDFTPGTSGSPSTTGRRFYRVEYTDL